MYRLAVSLILSSLFCFSSVSMAYTYGKPDENSCDELRQDIAWYKMCYRNPAECTDSLILAQQGYSGARRELKMLIATNLASYRAKNCGAEPEALPTVRCGSCW
jgi:hypothetical protein